MRLSAILLLLFALLLGAGCTMRAPGPAWDTGRDSAPATAKGQRGIASWYGGKYHGRTTANGERYDMYAMTAAHKTLPFGTRVKVTDLATGRSVVVRINDRGPFIRGRVIDLSRKAAERLGMLGKGLADVHLEILS